MTTTQTEIAILILGIIGFFVAKHIYNHKKNQTPLVCPINFDCAGVVHSDYSKFFGIPVEILGMTYYALISLSYLFMLLTPSEMPSIIASLIFGFSAMAFGFSLYLIGVQIFALKKGCSWCFVSASISTLIFILAWTLY